jgi:Phosphatidylinositol N-acetylglucosaminyltransferase
MAVKDEATKEPLPPWEKVLWKKQPYPDNYTPHTFLSALQMNSEAGRRSLSVAHPC